MRISDWSSDVCSSDLPILLSLICACLVGLAILVGQMVVDTSILLTSLISSAVVIITAPASKASYPARVLTSHLVAALTGLVLRSFLPISPWSVAAAVGFALLIVLVADRLHPPAIANAGIMFSANGSTLELIGLVAVTASILTGAAFLSRHCLLRVPTGKEPLSRSEEHTSELQSLMRISYAVFCLKKKKQPTHTKI